MSTPTFAETHNLVAFLEKPAESAGFEKIIDFLESIPIHYALTMNPTIYVSCVKQFWATMKVLKVNDQEEIQALVDKTKVIITEDNIRSDLRLDDAEGTVCLLNEAIFEGLARTGYEKPSQKLTLYKAYFYPQWKFMIHTILQCLGAKTTAWNEFSNTMAFAIICLADNQKFNFLKYIFDNMVKSIEGGVKFYLFPRFLQVFLDKQVEGMARHKKMYVISSHTKNIFSNMRIIGASFSGVITPLLDTMMVQAPADMGDIPVETYQTFIVDQPSTSKPQKPQKPKRKHRKEEETSHDEDHVSTPSSDILPSSEDRFILNELMVFCTSLQEQVFDLQEAKDAQEKEIVSLKKKITKLTKWRKSRSGGLRRLKRIGSGRIVKSLMEKDGLGAQEDASKQERVIEEIDQNAEIALDVETQRRTNDDEMFGDDDLTGEEDKGKVKMIEPEVP
nr:hypothetical protein [Tanacetum cinerariifolium]